MNSSKYTLRLDKGTCNLIKLLAALMVMMHHFSQYILSSGHSSNFIYHILSADGGYLGVAIFFFLSGYGLMESEMRTHLSPLLFLKKRFAKIYLPVLLITGIWIIADSYILGNQVFMGGGII